jgi:hypothetical protein
LGTHSWLEFNFSILFRFGPSKFIVEKKRRRGQSVIAFENLKSFKCICYEFLDGLKAFHVCVSDFVSCGKLGIAQALEHFLRLKTLLPSLCRKHLVGEILQVMEARAKWMQELQCQTPTSISKMSEHEWFGRSTSRLKESSNTIHEDYEDYSPVSSRTAHYEDTLHRTYSFESTMPSTTYETEKHPVESNEMPFIDKSVIEEKPFIKTEDKNVTVGTSSEILVNSYEDADDDDDDDDDWPEEDIELDGCRGTAIALINEEDISFSDLEDDDFQAPTKLKFISKE